MRSVGVIVVLYRPTREHLANVMAVRSQCSTVIAVDNTPEPDTSIHLALREAGVTLLVNRNRNGLAGAYNRGVEALLPLACDGVMFLDQDSSIPDGYLAAMVEGVASLEGEPFLVGPRIHERDLDMLVPLTVESVEPGVPDHLVRTDFVISSGSLLSMAAFETLGSFRDDYFIEAIDIEYCFRAHRLGVPIYVNTSVVLHHVTGDITQRGRFYATNHNATRCYYRARNFIDAHTALPQRGIALRRIVGFVLRQLFAVAFVESDKARKVTATLLGVLDGLARRLGPLEHRHPRVAAWLSRGRATVPIAVSAAETQ